MRPFLALLLGISTTLSWSQPKELPARLREAAVTHQKWKDSTLRDQGCTTTRVTHYSFGKLGFDIRTVRQQLGESVLCTQEVLQAEGEYSKAIASVGIGRNSRYFFRLNKPNASRYWTVADVVRPVPPDWLDRLDPLERTLIRPSQVDSQVVKEPLMLAVTDLSSLEGLTVTALEESGNTIDFSCRFVIVDGLRRHQRYSATARVRLLVTRQFATEWSKIEYGDDTYRSVREIANKFEEQDTTSARVIGAEVLITCHEHGKLTRDDKTIMVTAHVSRLSETDFTLSAFGLPEPFGIEWEKPTPWWLYLICGGLGVIVLLAVGYRLRKAGWLGQAAA